MAGGSDEAVVHRQDWDSPILAAHYRVQCDIAVDPHQADASVREKQVGDVPVFGGNCPEQPSCARDIQLEITSDRGAGTGI